MDSERLKDLKKVKWLFPNHGMGWFQPCHTLPVPVFTLSEKPKGLYKHNIFRTGIDAPSAVPTESISAGKKAPKMNEAT